MSLYSYIDEHDPVLANDISIWARWLDRITTRRDRGETIPPAEMDAFQRHWRDANHVIRRADRERRHIGSPARHPTPPAERVDRSFNDDACL